RRTLACPKRTWPRRCVCKAGNMEHPKAVGDRSTMAIILALQQAGLAVYLPFGENTRSDLILEDGDKIKRVQCKATQQPEARHPIIRRLSNRSCDYRPYARTW